MRFSVPAACCCLLIARRAPCKPLLMTESEMAYRKRMAESGGGGDNAQAGKLSDASRGGPDMATSVDDMDFFGGSGGGGTLTREGIQNAQRTRSKTIDALEELQEAVKLTGDLPPEEAAEELSRVIGRAYEDGVSVTAPPMKRAAALLAALENARATPQQAAAADDGLDAKLNALFGDFAPPILDEEE